MTYHSEDFTEEQYRSLLQNIIHKCIFYNEIKEYNSFSLWRHDVDASPHRAYTLAKIEMEEGIKSTYFIQLGSIFYNIFEEDIKEIFLKIKELGHELGLHFDPTLYDIKSKEDLEKYLTFEKNILENLFQTQIKVFSFHNPTEAILKNDEFQYADMINTYAKYFKENVEYCSDSNGYWRHKRLEDFLKEDFQKIQVLTHPVWWQKEIMLPRDRIQRCIEGKAYNNSLFYDNLLFKNNRLNIRNKDKD